ncbi:MAG: maleylpyruvate isomerase family mycothiol-dependent enzyme [Acidimicrobiia bacterium]
MNDWDYASAYRELLERVTDLVRAHPDELDEVAPATPEWRVRDIVAHLAGICDDVAHARLDGVGSEEWTNAQVEPRRGWSTERLLDDWREHASAIEPQIGTFPPIVVGQMITDAYTHEQDIRGALRTRGGRDASALAIAFDWGTDRLGDRLDQEGHGSVVFETDTETKTVGPGEPVTRLRADRFDVVRGFTGRRSLAQLKAMDWDGPFEPEALLLSTTLFRPAATDLVE